MTSPNFFKQFWESYSFNLPKEGYVYKMEINLDTFLDSKFKKSLEKSLEIIEGKIQRKISNMSGESRVHATEMWFEEFKKILKEELKEIPLNSSPNTEKARQKKNENYRQKLSSKKAKIVLMLTENPKITITKIAENLGMSRYGLNKNKELMEYIKKLKEQSN